MRIKVLLLPQVEAHPHIADYSSGPAVSGDWPDTANPVWAKHKRARLWRQGGPEGGWMDCSQNLSEA